MNWEVLFHDAFVREFNELDPEVQVQLVKHAGLLKAFGPSLGRPRVDTLKGSKHSNMKELRFDAAGGVWRAAFAFDPKRRAVVVVAGDKRGENEKRLLGLAHREGGRTLRLPSGEHQE